MEVNNESSNTYKVNKVLLILVIVLVMIILLFGAYFLGLNNNDKNTNTGTNNNSSTDTSNEEQDDQEETKKLTLTEVEQLLDKFGFNIDLGCKKNIYAYKYSEEFKMLVALSKVNENQKVVKNCSDIYTKDKYDTEFDAYSGQVGICIEENGTKAIAYDTINSIYKELYGADMPKQSVSGLKVNSSFQQFYDYDEVNNQFVTLECGACGGTCGADPITLNKIKNYTETESDLIVQIYYIEGYSTTPGQYIFDGMDMLIAPDNESAIKEIESKYLDKVDVYEVVFAKQNGNYLFKSLNKKLN